MSNPAVSVPAVFSVPARVRMFTSGLALAAGVLLAVALLGAPAPARAADLAIGYLQLSKDPRYSRKRTYARYLGQALGRPYSGAKVALSEVKFHAAVVDAEFKLQRIKGKSPQALVDKMNAAIEAGVRFFLVDAPAPVLTSLGQASADKDVLLFNVSARDDALRQSQCQLHVMHVIPSYAMQMDALAQLLRTRKWDDVLVLKGPTEQDAALLAAFERAAKRFGIDIEDVRPFRLGNDPRAREENNIALLTAKGRYDVIFIADSDGEFARQVPYRTAQARPIVGTEGVAAVAWHWAWDRHGAPQLEGRFVKQAKRPMTGVDWAAWMAVKAIANAVQRTASVDYTPVSNFLTGGEIILDGFKGNRLSFRPWNNQLRQPLLLATHNWVIERAPMAGFLHRTNNMDGLGLDAPDSSCKLR